MKHHKSNKAKILTPIVVLLFALFGAVGGYFFLPSLNSTSHTTTQTAQSVKLDESESSEETTIEDARAQREAEEKAYLKERFDALSAINSDVIGYIYAPGTPLDEPVVQTTDNEHYLLYMFEGGYDNYIGTVFMDTDNSSDYSDQLTWMFGHARGSNVSDARAFRTVNYYEDPTYFKEHPYVIIETPEKKLYFEAAFFIVVPETTAFYKTSFESDDEFVEQLEAVKQDSVNVNEDITIDKSDRYLVMSTCREEDPTIRTNLYLRRLTDEEATELVEKEGSNLDYVPKR